MPTDTTPVADFPETTTDVDVEEDCWLLIGEVAKTIVDRACPPARRSGQVISAAYPGRTNPIEDKE